MDVSAFSARRLGDFMGDYPYTREFFNTLTPELGDSPLTLSEWLAGLSDDQLREQGMERDQVMEYLHSLILRMDETRQQEQHRVTSLTILGGKNKAGKKEHISLTIRPGEIICLVGPTGAGKSRLLADIECLAQQDTPSCRQILLDHKVPTRSQRFDLENKLVAQISQNMNFVVDLSVLDFITMHARSRMVQEEATVTEQIIACANDLTGEKFLPTTSITQLSGGQSRALMIADTALLSRSPIILIDEIENAGVDRKRALELLINHDKIVFIATHDPLLALTGKYRVVIQNGGIASVIESSQREKRNLVLLEQLDSEIMALRSRIRSGEKIDDPLSFIFSDAHVQGAQP